jgi:hypothetical protein
MIRHTEQTTDNLGEIKLGIREVKRLVQEYESARNR